MQDDDTTQINDAAATDASPMSDVQRVQLDTLSAATGEPTPGEHLSEAEAARTIQELRDEAGYDTSMDDQDEP